MDRSTWSTMEDVQADLARAAGRPDRLVYKDCLQYGKRPPPPPRVAAGEDAEIQLQFGPEVAAMRGMLKEGLLAHHPPAPDLGGITKMLRMVESYGKERTSNDATPSINEVIVISKLNPSAKEFIPGPAVAATRTSINLNNNLIVNEQTKDYKQYQKERDELASMLKSKIRSESQGDDSFQNRQEKYAAIINLFKLHSSFPPVEPIELRTPDYFKCRRADADQERPPPRVVVSEPETQLEGSAVVDEAEVKASIFKVSNWLDSKPCVPCAPSAPTVPLPAPHLGPVGYKRKQLESTTPSPSQSPSPSGHRAECKQGKATAAYVPSAHAQELSQRYSERADAERRRHKASMWDALEEQLRRKDRQLRAREARDSDPSTDS